MTVNNFAFTPADGLRNAGQFPTTPASEADARDQVQDISDQLKDFINNTIITELNNRLLLTGGDLTGDLSTTGKVTATGILTGSALIASGLTGATQASRYVGATTSGAPTIGTFNKTDWCMDATGIIWVCTTAGTPGTWTKIGGTAAAIATGTYTGDGVNGRTISVGFTPKLVYVGNTGSGSGAQAMIAGGNSNASSMGDYSTSTNTTQAFGATDTGSMYVTSGGFVVLLNGSAGMNVTSQTYNWVAIG